MSSPTSEYKPVSDALSADVLTGSGEGKEPISQALANFIFRETAGLVHLSLSTSQLLIVETLDNET